jgi:hypothetical protein
VDLKPQLDKLVEAADVEALCERLDGDLPGLVRGGWLQALDTHPHLHPLDWTGG